MSPRFSWYTYSPTRVRYPYVRSVPLEMYREAKTRLKDPVLAWADIPPIRSAGVAISRRAAREAWSGPRGARRWR